MARLRRVEKYLGLNRLPDGVYKAKITEVKRKKDNTLQLSFQLLDKQN